MIVRVLVEQRTEHGMCERTKRHGARAQRWVDASKFGGLYNI
jgi:hypothetical protein